MTPRLFALLVLLPAIALADPPRVIKAVPDNGDESVDPALTELRVEFDQDMSTSGHSICGGGPSFPEITARPRWEGKRVIVVPIRLKPDQYHLMINCPAAQNCRGENGEAAEVYPISFKTRAAAAAPQPKLTKEQNRAAIAALANAIDQKYSYRDLRKVDWKKAVADASPRLEAADTPAAFAREAARLLEPAKDLHCSIRVGEQVIGTHRRMVTPNISRERLSKAVPDLSEDNEQVWTGRFDGGVGYINLVSLSFDEAATLKPALDLIGDEDAAGKGLILDLHFNSGGDERMGLALACRLIERKAVYSKNTYRDPAGKDGFTAPIDRVIEPCHGGKPYKPRVAVLIGPANMSSCESLILMLKTSLRVTAFGEKTFGSSGNPRPHDLGNGVTAVLSSWQDMTPSGRLIEGCGIAPDREIKTRPADFEKSDPVLDAALKWVREGTAGKSP